MFVGVKKKNKEKKKKFNCIIVILGGTFYVCERTNHSIYDIIIIIYSLQMTWDAKEERSRQKDHSFVFYIIFVIAIFLLFDQIIIVKKLIVFILAIL